jgi:hypothetical protein
MKNVQNEAAALQQSRNGCLKVHKSEMCIYKLAALPTIHRFQNVSGTAQTTVSGLYDRHTLLLM